MKTMKFGIGIIPQDNLEENIELIKLAEDVGFEYAWISHKSDMNMYQLLKAITLETETIKIGPGVTNPYIKNVENFIYEMIHLNNLSNKRTVFGIGPGNRKIMKELNRQWSNPVSTLKEYVQKLHESFEKKKSNIPIYIGAQSPKLLRISGEISDGCIVNASHPKDYEELLPHIQKGIDHSKKDMKDFDIAAYTPTSIDNDIEIAKNASKIVVAFIIAGCAPPLLERHDIPQEVRDNIYLSLSRGNIGNALRFIDDDLIDIFSVAGTSKEIIPKIDTLKESGVTQFIVSAPFGRQQNESIKLFEDVISSF